MSRVRGFFDIFFMQSTRTEKKVCAVDKKDNIWMQIVKENVLAVMEEEKEFGLLLSVGRLKKLCF